MLIISHRGHWKTAEEKNTLQAFERSFALGFGAETDIRDYQDNLVISHDIPDEQCMRADIFFQVYNRIDPNLPLALNIKSDGLHQKIKELLNKYHIENYFVFDMSVPDALGYLQSGMNTFTRQSEYEASPAFYKEAQGVWIDCFFRNDWIDERIISQHLERDKRVCLVSPELHKREYQQFWQKLATMKVVNDSRLMLCTDYPREAKELFGD